MGSNNIPQPGPAKLTKNSGIDEWLQCALQNQYLPEAIIKKLCEMCKELLMEGGDPPSRGKSPYRPLQRLIITLRIKHTARSHTCDRLW